MIIKYKGTDEHGVFRMGVCKIITEKTLHDWIAARDHWVSLRVDSDRCVYERAEDSPSPRS